MSTTRLRALIDRVADEHGEGWVREALKELEAIEKACVRIAGGYLKVSVLEDGDEPHRDLLERIGEETAAR